jgi:uncharacterized paraquat-inducible protein A
MRMNTRTAASVVGLVSIILVSLLGVSGCQPGEEAETQMEAGTHMEAGTEMDAGHADMDSAAEGDVMYTCPMHPEVQSAQPGKCPECGMYLVEVGSEEASMDASDVDLAVWTCPMHPEVQRHEPGECPECGMDLIETGAESTK